MRPSQCKIIVLASGLLELAAWTCPASAEPSVPHQDQPPRPVWEHQSELPRPKTGAAPTSLEEILSFANEHAPRLLLARARLGLGEAAVVQASPRLPENPRLSLGIGPGFNSGGRHVDFSASLSQRLEIGGERGLRLDAAGRRQQRLSAEYEEARWEVHREVHAAFHRALVARERLAVAERLLAFQERLLDITRRRLQAGDVSPLAVRLADGELSQSRVARIAAEQQYSRTRLELGAFAGWPLGRSPEPAGRLDEPREPPTARLLAETAQRYQPRFRTLQAAQSEARAHSELAEREAWPEPSVGLQLNRESFPQGPPETQVLGVLSIPIPLVRRNQGARAHALANVRIVDAESAYFASQLARRIEQDRAAVLAAAARVRTYGTEILPTFEENLRLIQRAFELGEIDILQVSVARERFLRIQTDALDAYVDYFEAVADLEGAIGTDLWPEEHHEHGNTAEHGDGRLGGGPP